MNPAVHCFIRQGFSMQPSLVLNLKSALAFLNWYRHKPSYPASELSQLHAPLSLPTCRYVRVHEHTCDVHIYVCTCMEARDQLWVLSCFFKTGALVRI